LSKESSTEATLDGLGLFDLTSTVLEQNSIQFYKFAPKIHRPTATEKAPFRSILSFDFTDSTLTGNEFIRYTSPSNIDLSSGTANCYLKEYNLTGWYRILPVNCSNTADNAIWLTDKSPNIPMRYFKLNSLYEFVIASTDFNEGFTNEALAQANVFVGTGSPMLDRTVDIQLYEEFIELQSAYFTSLEYASTSDMIF
jgi:hypothetical protein